VTANTQTLLDEAIDHLTAAANLARRDGTPRGHAVAGVIQLTRAAITPGIFEGPDPTPGPATVIDHLQAALIALDLVDPLDGPPDLLAWSWQLADLIRVLGRDKARQA
jgi:hypothetical protein